MRITGDNDIGKAQLENFIDEESTYPVIAVTSKLMTTGVDAKMCKLIVLENNLSTALPSSNRLLVEEHAFLKITVRPTSLLWTLGMQ